MIREVWCAREVQSCTPHRAGEVCGGKQKQEKEKEKQKQKQKGKEKENVMMLARRKRETPWVERGSE